MTAAGSVGNAPPAGRVRALIVDDEALARRRLAAMLAAEPAIHVIGQADGGSAAVEAIAGLRPDVVFLDVQMPGLDGFGVLRCTAGAHQPVVVFVTAHDEHAIRAFDVHAADYLLKPVTAARLRAAVHRAVARVLNRPRDENARALEQLLAHVAPSEAAGQRIPIRQSGGTFFVNAADITWVEANGDHLRVHAGSAVYTIRDTLASFGTVLQPFNFVRVHRSALVNRDAVSAVKPVTRGGHYLILRDGARVRSGRRYRAAVKALVSAR